jgi:hypothetical protein
MFILYQVRPYLSLLLMMLPAFMPCHAQVEVWLADYPRYQEKVARLVAAAAKHAEGSEEDWR